MAVMAFVPKPPYPRPHVALGPRIEELPRPEVLGVEGASPWSPSRSGSAGAGEVVEAGAQEFENSIASRSPLSLSLPRLSLTVPHAAWAETTLNPEGVKHCVVTAREETSKGPARSADARSLTAVCFLSVPFPCPQDDRRPPAWSRGHLACHFVFGTCY